MMKPYLIPIPAMSDQNYALHEMNANNPPRHPACSSRDFKPTSMLLDTWRTTSPKQRRWKKHMRKSTRRFLRYTSLHRCLTAVPTLFQTVSSPLKEGHHFDQSLGGIAGLFESLRANTQVRTVRRAANTIAKRFYRALPILIWKRRRPLKGQCCQYSNVYTPKSRTRIKN